MSLDHQDAYLARLEAGGKGSRRRTLRRVLRASVGMSVEGYFSDPVYGGNRNMVAWRMIGFPGAYAFVLRPGRSARDEARSERPSSLAEDAHAAYPQGPGHPGPLAGGDGSLATWQER